MGVVVGVVVVVVGFREASFAATPTSGLVPHLNFSNSLIYYSEESSRRAKILLDLDLDLDVDVDHSSELVQDQVQVQVFPKPPTPPPVTTLPARRPLCASYP